MEQENNPLKRQTFTSTAYGRGLLRVNTFTTSNQMRIMHALLWDEVM